MTIFCFWGACAPTYIVLRNYVMYGFFFLNLYPLYVYYISVKKWWTLDYYPLKRGTLQEVLFYIFKKSIKIVAMHNKSMQLLLLYYEYIQSLYCYYSYILHLILLQQLLHLLLLLLLLQLLYSDLNFLKLIYCINFGVK